MSKSRMLLRRLQIVGQGRILYDHEFHQGLNVIRGENSTGKSTLMDFIFFALGGNIYSWREAALMCDVVKVEASFNDTVVTLKRYVEQRAQRPMLIFWGNMNESDLSGDQKWEVLQFKRSSDKESFSKALFRLLGFPDANSEESSSVTMHQIMRLMYSDQMSPVEEIFKYDPWDSVIIRESVGAFLCGAYDPSLYEQKTKLRMLEKELEDAETQLKSIFAAFPHIERALNMAWVDAERKKLESEKAALSAKLEAIKLEAFSERSRKSDQHQAAAALRTELNKLDDELRSLEERLQGMIIEQADIAHFIQDISDNLSSLDLSTKTREVFGAIEFEVCPSCLAPLSKAADDHCGLCRSPLEHDKAQSQAARLRRDMAAQVRESESLLSQCAEEISRLRQRKVDLVDKI